MAYYVRKSAGGLLLMFMIYAGIEAAGYLYMWLDGIVIDRDIAGYYYVPV